MPREPLVFVDPDLPAPVCRGLMLALQATMQRVCRVEVGGRAVW